MADSLDTGSFTLGTPALVCRWRLAGGRLAMESRHMRALRARTVNGARVSQALVAWARQHIEWTLKAGSANYPDGVLMLIVDEQGQAAMTVGPYEPLPNTSLLALADRSALAHKEAEVTGVPPETLWVVRDDCLYCDNEPATTSSGAVSLVESLAHTLGMPVRRDPSLRDLIALGNRDFDEAFLVSDEHGVVPAMDYGGPRGDKYQRAYQRLLDNTRK